MEQLKAIKGMPDILPAQTPVWQHIERCVATLAAQYAYREIRFPLIESTALFQRSIGEVTDIVEKEMYSFPDRNGDSLTLRPEGTAGCVRAVLQNGLLQTLPQRLWYQGPMFRYERPQLGRQRQFHQVGVEGFGVAGPELEAEQILLTERLWKRLGVRQLLRLEINSLGSSEARTQFREALVAYLLRHVAALDADSQRRLQTNPLRILDSKITETQEILRAAPALVDFLDAESVQHFRELCELLDAAGITYTVNPRLVRGLDYYSQTVYEWVTDSLGAQGTVCGGGRYDGLVTAMGGPVTPAAGFAIGLERLVLLLEVIKATVRDEARPHAFWVVADAAALSTAIGTAEGLRDEIPGLAMQMPSVGASLKSQMKKADRSGAEFALIVGADELRDERVSLRSLREPDSVQTALGVAELTAFLREHVARIEGSHR